MAYLRKPASRLYSSFLYLDGDEVLNSLSAIEGGDVDEILTKSGEEGSSGRSGELDAKVAKGKGGKRKAQRFEEEMKRKRTTHSAATALLRKLHDEDAIGIVEGDYDATVHADLEEHMTIELEADIRIHPVHQALSAAQSLLDIGPGYGMEEQEVKDIRSSVEVVEQLVGRGARKNEQTFLAFAETEGTQDGHYLAMQIKQRHLLVPLDEFSGRATFVAQVDRILSDGDEIPVLRFLRDAPLLPVEQEGLAEVLPAFVRGMEELGVESRDDEFTLKEPTVTLKPICIYK